MATIKGILIEGSDTTYSLQCSDAAQVVMLSTKVNEMLDKINSLETLIAAMTLAIAELEQRGPLDPGSEDEPIIDEPIVGSEDTLIINDLIVPITDDTLAMDGITVEEDTLII